MEQVEEEEATTRRFWEGKGWGVTGRNWHKLIGASQNPERGQSTMQHSEPFYSKWYSVMN